MKELMPQETIAKKIFIIRGQKVMLDSDLAELFGVQTKQLNRQVKRNIQRFPEEFMFRLTKGEKDELVPIWHQFETMKHSYALPYAFTEHGVAMLASVLNSQRAIKMSIIIVKTFVKLREMMSAHKELLYKLNDLERKIQNHDKEISDIFSAIRQLMGIPSVRKKIKGFARK
ncbi:MAG: ORF6N domain-containing protein [Candidatus Omnitrophica bacterium]|nr:ORF6N domain-containing protein [Candidatus Omnitrophota bacterium]